ncbi:hypothetical protein D3C71_1848540 [compost metagenome]
MAEERRGAATEVQLFDALPAVEVVVEDGHFLFQRTQIVLGATAILGDHLVAGAVVACVRAERQMHIE